MGGLRWADDQGLDDGYGYGGSSSSGYAASGRGYGSGSRGGRGSRGGGGWGGGRLGGRGRGVRTSHRHSHGSAGSASGGGGYGDGGMGGYHDVGETAPVGSGMMSDTYVSAQSLQAGSKCTGIPLDISPCDLTNPSIFIMITTVYSCVFDVTWLDCLSHVRGWRLLSSSRHRDVW